MMMRSGFCGGWACNSRNWGMSLYFWQRKVRNAILPPLLSAIRNNHFRHRFPEGTDLVHFFYKPSKQELEIATPYLITYFDNSTEVEEFDRNTVFLSQHHAIRHGGIVHVYPGIDFRDYGTVIPEMPRNYFHFLGDSAWRGQKCAVALLIWHQKPIHGCM